MKQQPDYRGKMKGNNISINGINFVKAYVELYEEYEKLLKEKKDKWKEPNEKNPV
jgi:hypothetical protein